MIANQIRLFLVVVCAGQLLRAESTPINTAGTDTTNTLTAIDGIMEINGWTVPTDWFLHEFRSTFFRYAGVTNIRHEVFAPFRNRMILHAKAVEQGIDQDPELLAAIEARTRAMRSFMDYQLEMVKIDMVNDVLIKQMGIQVSPEALTEAQLERFYNEKIKPRPGAPDDLSDVPAHIMESIKAQAAQVEMERQLERLIRDWQTNMVITVNEEAVESVPMPDMQGQPPGMPSR